MNRKKRTPLMLAIIMMLVLMPFSIFAEENTTETPKEEVVIEKVDETGSNIGETQLDKPQNNTLPTHDANIQLFAGKDITDRVTISKVSMYVIRDGKEEPIVLDGVAVNPQPSIYVGDEIKTHYSWSISEENMTGLNPGDSFVISLPAPHHILSLDSTFDLVSNSNEILGIYQIFSGTIKVTLNELAVAKLSLKNGFFNVQGKAEREGTQIAIDDEGEITITIEPDPGSGPPGGGDDGGTTPFPDEKLEFAKDGKQYDGLDSLNWHVNINYSEFAKLFSNSSVITEKQNVILEDILPKGLTIDPTSFMITTPLFIPYSENLELMSGTAVAYLRWKLDTFPIDSKTDYQTFYNSVKNGEITNPGVYTDNKSVIYVFLGNLPYNGITYSKLAGGASELNSIFDNYKDMTEAQRSKMKEIYGENGPTKGHILAYDISFDTSVTGESGKYTNRAILHWDEISKDDGSFTIDYKKSDAGVEALEPKSIKIEKKDNHGNPLIGVAFKLQRLNVETSEYEDYVALDDDGTLERETDVEGVVRFAKLNTGKYKIVETKLLEGYGSPIYKPSEFFEINDTDTGGLLFTVVNPETTQIQVTKAWDDDNNNDGLRPTSIQVQLMANDVDIQTPITLNTSNAWTHTWKDLAKYDDQRNLISYTVKELGSPTTYTVSIEAANGSVPQIDGKDWLITNTHVPEVIKIEGIKVWRGDSEDNHNTRPQSITVNLYADGTPVDSVQVSASDNWAYQFTGLKKYKDGNEIQYTVSEDPVDNYTSDVDGYNIYNDYTPNTTSIRVTKAWVDDDNIDNKRPNSVSVQLFANGEKVGSAISLNDDNKWTYTWDSLEKFVDGKEIIYTVSEVEVPEGYSNQVTIIDKNTVVITNTYSVDDPPKPEEELPKTGKSNLIIPYVLLLELSGISLLQYRKKMQK